MTRKQSDSQDAVAAFFESVASAVERDRGIFLDQTLTAPEARVVIRNLRGLCKDYRDKATANRSIGA